MPEYKRPESVLVLVHAADGRTLLLERTEPAGFWQSVTGSLRPGETPLEAARRELAEETGITAEPEDCGLQSRFPILPAWRARYRPEVRSNLEHVFRVDLPAAVAVRLNPSEHLRCRWLAPEQALQRISSATNAYALRRCPPRTASGAPGPPDA